jgi:hypothetical protein
LMRSSITTSFRRSTARSRAASCRLLRRSWGQLWPTRSTFWPKLVYPHLSCVPLSLPNRGGHHENNPSSQRHIDP